MAKLVLLDRSDQGVATLSLNRPETRNSVSGVMLDALDDAINELTADESVRVAVLTGVGETFCAGADLDEVRGDRTTIHRLLMRLSHVMRKIHRLSIPSIARVEGAAIGGGFGLMMVADFAVTHPEAKIGYPPPETGLSPAVTAPYLLRKVSPGRARAMLLRGGTISGRDAAQMGLVTELVPIAELGEATHRLAMELVKGGALATRRMKRLLNALDEPLSDEILDDAARVSADVVASEETRGRLRHHREG